VNAELDDAKKRHAEQISLEREAHDAHCRRRSDELDEREKRTAELHKQAEADAAAAAKIRKDFERRLRIVSGEAA